MESTTAGKTRRFAIIGSTAVALGIGLVLAFAPGASAAAPVAGVPAAAAVATTAGDPSPDATVSKGGGALSKECRVLKKIDTRAEKWVVRVNGSVTTKGSVAWLNAQAVKAKAAGDTELATKLAGRAVKVKAEAVKVAALDADLTKLHAAHC